MIIRDIFSKPIDRDLKGVIKVGQAEDENIKQELEEYVVTKELQKHFATFFSNYKRGINGRTDKMGVWISGFFGSGKSHFLKIISYILENKTVDGVPAIEYFERDRKIADSMVLADMKLAANTPSTVILFNIDSKSESTGKKDKEAILSVFLKVFNEKLGFCGAYPHVADLERKLTEEGKYEQFKSKFEEISGDSWLEERTAIDFIQDELVETLVAINFMSEEAAQRWCDKATEPYSLSIERFAELIKKYIDSKERNHHLIFLVDEIGQYVGDDTDLMLNLQTVTEDLGTACGGKAWVIVTSQQDIDSITKVKGRDFSKIQGRFDTRLSLSSADVAEVIRKRILDKNETGKSSLSVLYDDKATVIKNLILFNDDVEKKLYSGRDDFAITYPFVPYQFNLLGSVLTAVRTYGASGKHLADGERSMLALFKESAMRLENKELGAIVPFYMFYGALEEFIDHSHRGVITKALDNEKLNPEHEADCFDVNVLKVLFMIKYVKEIKATVENITSLMVSDINEDRIELKQKVEAALKRLIKQTLVQKSAGETYVFLTNEEQEINRAVENQNIEQGEITAKVSELIFDGLYSENKYRAPELKGRYTYGFNRFVDSRPHKANQNFALTLKVLTPNSDEAKINYASHGGLYNQKYNGIRGICWNLITSYKNGFRLKHEKHHYSSGSPTIISINNNMDYYVLAFLNSIVASSILSMLNPTLNTTVNDVLSLPLITSRKECVENVSYSNTLISQRDWDSFETSWDFKRHPLVVGSGQCLVDRTNHSSLITNHYKAWESECLERFNKLKANEEELNRIFIEIYGLQDELTPDVADKDITVHRVFDSKDDVPESMKGSSYIRTKRDEVVSLISYAVGCMFGRYSLDKEGLIFAGGNFNDTFIEDALYPSDTLYPSDNLFPKEPEYSKLKTDDGEIDLSFYPDYDNCIPITDTKYFDDDIVGRFEEFIKAVYGSNTLEQNLDFIAKALGTKGNTSRDVIRNYFLNDFFKDHCKIYQKRPIYWLFDSGKQNGFKALCYMHRWNADTIGNMRVEYLHRIQRTYEKEIEREQDTIDNTTNNRDKAAAIKRKEKLLKQLKEAKDYDAKVAHLALSRPDIDLDDGVKVNYEKVQTAQDGKKLQILAKI